MLGQRAPHRVAEVVGLGEHRPIRRGDYGVEQLGALQPHVDLGIDASGVEFRSGTVAVAPVRDQYEPRSVR